MLYPALEPYAQGMLDVGDGQHIYWETSGNPYGRPVIAVHGGPGSGSRPHMRRFFDPQAYRIVLVDQRGCGHSQPHASDPATDLSVNTTSHLVADMERVRQHLNIDRWMVFGGSWGSTLALVYAERYPGVVIALVLWGTALTRPAEITWLYQGVAPLFPVQWAAFRAGVPEAREPDEILDAYFWRLQQPDPAVRITAARHFHDWEWALFTFVTQEPQTAAWQDPLFQVARARIITHYFRHHAWLDDNQIIRQADRLATIPSVMVHGRLDIGSPLQAAWDLTQVWSVGELVIVGGAGHSTADPGMDAAIVAATNQFAGQV